MAEIAFATPLAWKYNQHPYSGIAHLVDQNYRFYCTGKEIAHTTTWVYADETKLDSPYSFINKCKRCANKRGKTMKLICSAGHKMDTSEISLAEWD